MKPKKSKRQTGFTILELLTVVAVIGILGAISVVGYQQYTARAKGADIITKYDAIRAGVGARAQTAKTDNCAALVSGFGTSNLTSDYAGLNYGLEAVADGYRPVLNVCAQLDPAKPLAVKVAREAHDVLARNGVVEKNAVVTDSVVSFALRLTDGDTALCKNAPAQPATTCGQSQPVAQPVAQPANPPACAADQERVGGSCVAKCPADSPRDPSSGQCVPLCHDEYGPTCAQDFGDMCTEDYVRNMCKKYCGVCVAPSGAAQGPAAQPAAVSPAVPQGVPANMAAGSAPGAPLVPKAVASTIYPTQHASVGSPEQWLGQVGGENPDGSPLRITEFRADPGFGTPSQRPNGDWGFTFANPGVKAEGYVEVTFENAAGRNTARLRIRTGTGW